MSSLKALKLSDARFGVTGESEFRLRLRGGQGGATPALPEHFNVEML